MLIGNCWNCVALDWVRLAYLENDRIRKRLAGLRVEQVLVITTQKIYGHPRVNPARSLKTVNAAPLCNAKGLQSSACTKQFQRERTKHSLSNGVPLHFPQGMRSRSCPDPASGWRTNRRRRKCSPETRPSSCQ